MKTSNNLTFMENELFYFIAESFVKKILSSFDKRMAYRRVEYRRLRWIVCSRTSLTKREANQILNLMIKEGLIATTKPQANSERLAWLTSKGTDFFQQLEMS